MNVSELSLDSSILSLGSLLGTTSSADLVRDINQHCGNSTFFGSDQDPFRNGFALFMKTIVEPVRTMGVQVKKTAHAIFTQDRIVEITSQKQLLAVPPCMQLPIIYYPPVRQMLEEERIDGFGISPKDLEDGDIYEPILNSGYKELHTSTIGKDGSYDLTYHWASDEPEFTQEERASLRETRHFIGNFMNDPETEHFDITDFPQLHC